MTQGPASATCPAMFIDSHCHLNYKGLVEDQPGVLARARAAGVSTMLNISTRASEWDAVIATAERESDVMASVGIHPHEADVHPDVETETLVEKARASQGDRHRRERARLLLRPFGPRPAARRASAPTSPPRARPSCR